MLAKKISYFKEYRDVSLELARGQIEEALISELRYLADDWGRQP